MKYRGPLFLLFLCALSQQVSAQALLDSIVARLDSLALNRPAEMVYLQTSKGVFETGEDLWFKAYILDTKSLYLSVRSQTLYLQMYSEDNREILWQEKYPVEEGIVAGHVYIAENLPDGNYFLEAFTRHSIYADSTQVSDIRKIRVQKQITQGSEAPAPENDSIRLNGFPEGGYMVSGLPCKLAFKATNGLDYPVAVKGMLYEEEAPILAFESSHAGMGTLQFTPFSGKTYKMVLPDGRTFPLPQVLPQGMSLQLTEHNSEFLEFAISQSDGLPTQTVYLVGQMRGGVCCAAIGRLSSRLTIKMPLAEFPIQGIASITLYDAQMRPVAERLVYVHPEKKLYITAESDKPSYWTREKATIKIKVSDENGLPVRAHLGLSVFDQAYVNPSDPVNILTYSHLSSQIPGRIYDPAYYYDEKNANRIESLDLLMLTQGWRRYVWAEENMQSKGEPVFTDEINGIQIITDKAFANTQQLIKVSMADGKSELLGTDTSGYFSIDVDLMKAFRGGYLYVKPMLAKKGTSIELDSDPFLVINPIIEQKKTFYPSFDLSHIPRPEVGLLPYANLDGTTMLNEVVVQGKSSQPFRDKFMGHLDDMAHMYLGPWVCTCGLSVYLNDYIEGYTHHPEAHERIGNYKGERLRPVVGKVYRVIKYEPRGQWWILVDEYETVYNGPIYTDEELLRMNNLWRIKGYYGAREFYHPDDTDMQMSVPSIRNTLIWAPEVITDTHGEATVSFYCSDINTKFVGKIEGLGSDSLLGVGGFDFRVLKRN